MNENAFPSKMQPVHLRVIFKILSVIIFISIIISVLCFSLFATLYNRAFYDWVQELNGTAAKLKVDQPTLDLLVTNIMKYFFGTRNTLQTEVQFTNGGGLVNFYTADELSHMVDVKVIFDVFNMMGFILPILLILIGTILILKDKNWKGDFAFGALVSSIVFLVPIAIIGIGMAIDFDETFTLFHKIMFPQGNWSFSTRMTTLLPGDLFMYAAFILLTFTVVTIVGLFVYGLTTTMQNYIRKTKTRQKN